MIEIRRDDCGLLDRGWSGRRVVFDEDSRLFFVERPLAPFQLGRFCILLRKNAFARSDFGRTDRSILARQLQTLYGSCRLAVIRRRSHSRSSRFDQHRSMSTLARNAIEVDFAPVTWHITPKTRYQKSFLSARFIFITLYSKLALIKNESYTYILYYNIYKYYIIIVHIDVCIIYVHLYKSTNKTVEQR